VSLPASPSLCGVSSMIRLRTLWMIRLGLMPVVTGILILTNRYWIPLDGSIVTAIAAGLILFIGVPHGTLDIEIASARFGQQGFCRKGLMILAYIGCAAAMAILWRTAPALGLVVFLLLSIIHFGADWQSNIEPFFGMTVGWALIAIPALSHPRAVTSLFEILTGNAHGAVIAAMLACSAIPALFGSVIFALTALSRRQFLIGVDVISCLIAAFALPPLIGFAIFFCGLHSPRHLADAIRQSGKMSAGRKATVASAVMALSLGIAALLFARNAPASVDSGLVRTAFLLLSILTVPHFILEYIGEEFGSHRRHFPC
jgi:beta-carotene 15,15'-dioxygenase